MTTAELESQTCQRARTVLLEFQHLDRVIPNTHLQELIAEVLCEIDELEKLDK